MTLAAREKTVLFLTEPDDPLATEFALLSASYGLEFFFSLGRTAADWLITWTCDDRGISQAWLDHIPSAQCHFLGTEPQRAMRAACRVITQWDRLEAAYETLAVQ